MVEMSLEEVADALVAMRLRTRTTRSDATHLDHSTLVQLGVTKSPTDTSPGRFALYTHHTSRQQRNLIWRALLDRFSDVANVEIPPLGRPRGGGEA